ncbi:hypothetical protein G3V71_23840, partial [Escherichia coli]|nr:hypothetical protein [Escherichia coli]
GIGEEILQTKLRSWSRRKDWDFFVHKDLKTFLARELDFYLKNEVVQLDNLFADKANVWEKTTYPKRARCTRWAARSSNFWRVWKACKSGGGKNKSG